MPTLVDRGDGILERGPKTTRSKVRAKVVDNTQKETLQSEREHVLELSSNLLSRSGLQEPLEALAHLVVR